jgi:hypothetical protein
MARLDVILEGPGYMCDPAGSHAFPDHANARTVYARLTHKTRPMPPDSPWPQLQIDIYSAWMAEGSPP